MENLEIIQSWLVTVSLAPKLSGWSGELCAPPAVLSFNKFWSKLVHSETKHIPQDTWIWSISPPHCRSENVRVYTCVWVSLGLFLLLVGSVGDFGKLPSFRIWKLPMAQSKDIINILTPLFLQFRMILVSLRLQKFWQQRAIICLYLCALWHCYWDVIYAALFCNARCSLGRGPGAWRGPCVGPHKFPLQTFHRLGTPEILSPTLRRTFKLHGFRPVVGIIRLSTKTIYTAKGSRRVCCLVFQSATVQWTHLSSAMVFCSIQCAQVKNNLFHHWNTHFVQNSEIKLPSSTKGESETHQGHRKAFACSNEIVFNFGTRTAGKQNIRSLCSHETEEFVWARTCMRNYGWSVFQFGLRNARIHVVLIFPIHRNWCGNLLPLNRSDPKVLVIAIPSQTENCSSAHLSLSENDSAMHLSQQKVPQYSLLIKCFEHMGCWKIHFCRQCTHKGGCIKVCTKKLVRVPHNRASYSAQLFRT